MRRLRGAIWIVLQVLVLAFAVHILLPEIAGVKATLEAVGHSSWVVIPIVLALETLSFVAYGELIRVFLGATGVHVSSGTALKAVMAGTALGRTLPGGTTAALAVMTRTLSRLGTQTSATAAGLAGSGMLSSLVLALLLPLAAALALVGRRLGGVLLGSASLAAIAVLVLTVGIRPVLARPQMLARWVEGAAAFVARGPLRRRVDPEVIGKSAEHAISSLDAIASSPRRLGKGVGWAAANWLFDAAALFSLAMTIGRGMPLWGVLMAYVIGQLVAALPITPGGVGIVEPAMTATLVAQGAGGGAAAATVLAWRVASNWLPIAVGLGIFPTLRAREAHRASPEK